MSDAKLYAYDAAYSPNLVKVKAAGGIAVNGYVTGSYSTSTTQPAAAHAAGLGYVPTYEEGRDELVGATRATGQAVGRRILAAFKAKGIPLDGTVAVYPSVDVTVSAGGATSCNEGWAGIRDVLAGKVSVRAYAEGAVIDALVKAGLVDGKCWLAAPTSWPGFNVNDPNVCMVQLVGTDVPGTDRNHLVTDPGALGAWWPDNSPYGGTVSAQDVISALESAEGKKALQQAVWSATLTAGDGTTLQAGTRLIRAQQVSPAALTAALKAAGVTASEQAVATALRAVFADLATPAPAPSQ